MVEEGEAALVMVWLPGPLTFDQRPEPNTGLFPAMVTVILVAGNTGLQCA